MNICLHCKSETKNPKFCCRSCASSYNNKLYHKRSVTGKCNSCNVPISSSIKYCSNCNPYKIRGNDLTLRDAIYTKHHRSSAYALIRSRARSYAKKLRWYKCVRCGYSKHIEIAHIKPISEFSLDTKIIVINSKSNLIALCPNCHWEHDHPNLANII